MPDTLEIFPLTGQHVTLEPLTEQHRELLREAAEDTRIWEYTLMLGTGAGFDVWFDATLSERDNAHKFPFVVCDLHGRYVGSTSFLDIQPRHRRLEIGATWYHPSVWGSVVNPECKLLLLGDAFDRLNMNRVSLLTDARNLRSQAAIAKLGAVREGLLRAHMVTQGARVRDSVLYSITRDDWPTVRAGLQARLAT